MIVDTLKDYNLGRVDKYLDDGIIIKPVVVMDGTGYEKFKVNLNKDEIKILKVEESESEEILMLPYNSNKILIDFE